MTPSSQRDDQQEQVDAGRARDHRPHEPLVARHIHHRQPPSGRQLERRVAELDRDAPRPLLRQPVGVDAGQRRDQRRLPVIDVPGGAERQRVIRSHSAAVSVRQSSRTRPSRTRATTGGSSSRRRAARVVSAVQRTGEREPARASAVRRRPRGRRSRPRLPPSRPASASARARTSSAGSATIRSTGTARTAAGRVAVQLEGRLQRGQRQLVEAQRACQRMAAHALDGVGACRRRCRPAARPAACRPRSRPASRRPRRWSGRWARRPGRAGRAAAPDPRSSISGMPVPRADARPARRAGLGR